MVSWKLNNDDIEVERIARSMPIVNYRGRDPQHLRWLNDFSEMASAWATLHWRGRCATPTVMWAGYAFMRQDEYEQAYELFEAASQGEARLLAVDAALDSLCTDHGIDPNAVRKLAGTETYQQIRKSDDMYLVIAAALSSAPLVVFFWTYAAVGFWAALAAMIVCIRMRWPRTTMELREQTE